MICHFFASHYIDIYRENTHIPISPPKLFVTAAFMIESQLEHISPTHSFGGGQGGLYGFNLVFNEAIRFWEEG